MHRRALWFWLFFWLAAPVEAQRVSLDSLSLADTSLRHVIKLRDGTTLLGRITAITTDSIRVRLAQGDVNMAKSGVDNVRQVPGSTFRDGQYWFENPHATRLLFSSTAFPLGKGTGYYSNAWLFMHTFALGINDRFTLGGGGTSIPGVALSDNLFYLLPKYTVIDGPRTKVALGALLGFFPFNSDVNDEVTSGGLLYVVGSTGNRESNVSLGVAWGYADDQVSSSPGLMIGGQGRVTRRFSLISENWFVPIDGETEGVVSYGLRFLGENLSVDLAWVSVLGSNVSVPWLGFAIRF